MRYLLMIYGSEPTWDSRSWQEERQGLLRAHADLQRELIAAGELVGTEGLTTVGHGELSQLPSGATTVSFGK